MKQAFNAASFTGALFGIMLFSMFAIGDTLTYTYPNPDSMAKVSRNFADAANVINGNIDAINIENGSITPIKMSPIWSTSSFAIGDLSLNTLAMNGIINMIPSASELSSTGNILVRTDSDATSNHALYMCSGVGLCPSAGVIDFVFDEFGNIAVYHDTGGSQVLFAGQADAQLVSNYGFDVYLDDLNTGLRSVQILDGTDVVRYSLDETGSVSIVPSGASASIASSAELLLSAQSTMRVLTSADTMILDVDATSSSALATVAMRGDGVTYLSFIDDDAGNSRITASTNDMEVRQDSGGLLVRGTISDDDAQLKVTDSAGDILFGVNRTNGSVSQIGTDPDDTGSTSYGLRAVVKAGTNTGSGAFIKTAKCTGVLSGGGDLFIEFDATPQLTGTATCIPADLSDLTFDNVVGVDFWASCANINFKVYFDQTGAQSVDFYQVANGAPDYFQVSTGGAACNSDAYGVYFRYE